MRKHLPRLVLFIIPAGCLGLILLAILATRSGHISFTPPLSHKPEMTADTSKFPSPLHASGSQILDSRGTPVILKGLMPPDPAKLSEKGKFGREFFNQMRAAGATVIRIPVHPERWTQDPDYLWRYLDPIVTWSGEAGMYVIIDLHYIGNVATGEGAQMPSLKEKPKDLALEFWRSVAHYFRNTPNVIFEIFNEPQSISAPVWQQNAQEIIGAIREQGAGQLVIVGGVEYSKDLSWVLDSPLVDPNLAYAAHIYPSHPQSSWPIWFGNVSEKYPVLITEWGFIDQAPGSDTAYLVGSSMSYAAPLLDYLDAHRIGWVACWYDDDWLPQIFKPGMQEFTVYGQFVMDRLKEK